MEYSIQVKHEGEIIYPIYLTHNYDSINRISDRLDIKNKKICIISDTNVSKLYMDEVSSVFREYAKEVYSYSFSPGEKHKNLETVYALYEQLILWKFDRKDILIALGGGVVGDLVGYVAATYLRGIAFVQMPSSLLAMVDSSVGGKTGVDFSGYKNMIGAFHQPSSVYININTLKTLPKEHYYNGMAEIIKHGLIKDIKYFNWLRENEELIHSFDIETLAQMIYQSCIIKKDVVENDPKEQGERALLNFGHTIGHAIEKGMDFQLLHGECVAIGMVAASYISLRLNYLNQEEFNSIIEILRKFKLPVSLKGYKKTLSSKTILEVIEHDKKQESGKLKFILIKRIGQAFIETDLSKEEIKEAIDYILDFE